MKGFKDSTKVQYMRGGAAEYAKGGDAKGAAKIAKVMGEFKRGDLHIGSKKGPEVKNSKQAVAIAMSEARKAGAKMPMKKAGGGAAKMPSAGASVESGNRMSAMEAAERDYLMRREKNKGPMTEREMRVMREMKKRVPVARREPMLPSPGESVESGNRMSRMMAEEARALGLKNGGLAAMPKKGKC